MELPTSNLEDFKKQLNNPNTGFKYHRQEGGNLTKIKKNIVLSVISDYTGCGHIRNILPFTYMNAVFGKESGIQVITTPVVITDPAILKRTRTVYFQRTMGPETVALIMHFKELQKQFKFKMVYDIDDFVWDGEDEGEEIPTYNFGKNAITHAVQSSAISNMQMMDTVCVSTQFLKDYIASRGVDRNKIIVVHNTLPTYLWGTEKKKPITEKIVKPKVLWSSSPTHWHDGNKLYGDMDNSWREWIIKSVKEDKIDYIQMGGLPWFFKEIEDKITVYNWVNSLHYPSVVRSINADFGISPLVPNYFNYSKSAIKYQEYCMVGTVGIGTTFTNGKPSPYDISVTRINAFASVEDIDELFDTITEPDVYNQILEKQYAQIIDNNWTTESAGYINMMTSII